MSPNFKMDEQSWLKPNWNYRVPTTAWFEQPQTKKIQGLFKDFSRTNYTFQGLRFILKKLAFFKPLLNTLSAKTRHGVIYHFFLLQPWLITLFYTTFCNNACENDWVWLATASEVHK